MRENKWKILSAIFLVIALISAFIAGYYVQKVNELTSTGAATAGWNRYLGDKNVDHIFEDSAGNIWFAGENPGLGVAKFDGRNWEIYDSRDIAGISSVTGIGEDNCGNVWVGTCMDGLSKFDGNEWTNYNASNSELLICNQIDLLFSDSSGNIWIETLKEGNGIVTNGIQCEYVIYKISDGNWTIYDKDTTGAGKSHCEYIDHIFEDWEGNLWFTGEIEGAIKFNGENWTAYNESEIGLKHVYSMFQDRNLNLWFGGCNRIVKLDRNGNITKYGVDGTVYDIIQGRDGNTYFATLAGVNVIPRDCNCSFTLLESGMYPEPHSMFCDDKGRIWFLTDEDGVFVYVREYTSGELGLYHYDIREPMTFFQDSSGNMWIGTLDGVLRFKE